MEENRVYKDVRKVLIDENLTFESACLRFNEAKIGEYNTNKLSQKLRNGSMKYNELIEIMSVLGYDVTITKRK